MGSISRRTPKRKPDERLSVVILGLDAVSHMNFIRQMPRTHSFLTEKLSAVGLQGYTKVGENTFPNAVALLSGLTVDQLRKECWTSKSTYFDKCPFIWRHFSKAGYRTSFAEDSVWMGTFSYEKKGFYRPPTDYYLHPLTLLMAKEIGHESWGNAKLCYGPRLAFEILLDYMVKTAVTFKNKLYFQYIWANSLFHDYLNNPKLGDEMLQLTLEYLWRNEYLNNTLLIIVSDHGIRWGGIRSTNQGRIEERMPTAYFAFPNWFRSKYTSEMKNLLQNAFSRLTTPFDVHATLAHILEIGTGKRIPTNAVASSLLRPIPAWRNCNSAGVEEHWCVCNVMEPIPRDSDMVKSAAQFIVKYLNQFLLPWEDSCAQLRLHQVTEAMKKVEETSNNSDANKEDSSKPVVNISLKNTTIKGIQLQITLSVLPSFAVLETTVNGDVSGNLWNISGDISRLNLYREQSSCIHDFVAQKYCFCKNLMSASSDNRIT